MSFKTTLKYYQNSAQPKPSNDYAIDPRNSPSTLHDDSLMARTNTDGWQLTSGHESANHSSSCKQPCHAEERRQVDVQTKSAIKMAYNIYRDAKVELSNNTSRSNHIVEHEYTGNVIRGQHSTVGNEEPLSQNRGDDRAGNR